MTEPNRKYFEVHVVAAVMFPENSVNTTLDTIRIWGTLLAEIENGGYEATLTDVSVRREPPRLAEFEITISAHIPTCIHIKECAWDTWDDLVTILTATAETVDVKGDTILFGSNVFTRAQLRDRP